MRLIDVDKLQKPIYAEEDNITGANMNLDEMYGYNDAIDMMWNRIEYAPTIDAIEVMHAHWIDMDGKHHPQSPVIGYGKGYGMCSHCKTVEWLFKNKLFCPYCGAMMDEVIE